MRLIAGPLADTEAAAQLYAKLAAARRFCQPVGFEGKQLEETEASAPRKPAAAPKSAPRTAAQPAPRVQQRLFP